jgi:hypothetical protein
MPTYTFMNRDDGVEVTLTMKIAELDAYKRDNPNMTQLLSPTPLADPTRVGVRTKPDSEFRDLLKTVKSKHRGNTIDTH